MFKIGPKIIQKWHKKVESRPKMVQHWQKIVQNWPENSSKLGHRPKMLQSRPKMVKYSVYLDFTHNRIIHNAFNFHKFLRMNKFGKISHVSSILSIFFHLGFWCTLSDFTRNTGCPNKFEIMFWSSEMNVSEASIVYESYEKFIFCSIKLLF